VTIWRFTNAGDNRHIPVRQFAAPEGMNATGGEPMMWLDEDFLLTACRGDCLLIWDVKTCKPIGRLRIPSTVVSFLLPPRGHLFYTSHADSTVIQWDAMEIVMWCEGIRNDAGK
jgi:WD40 repeat protein